MRPQPLPRIPPSSEAGPPSPGPAIKVRRRIRVRILLAFLTVTVSAVLITTSAQHLLARRAMRANVENRNRQIAAIAASKVTLYLRTSLNDLRAVGQIVVAIRDPYVLDVVLENTVTIHRQFGLISLVDVNGVVVGSSALDNALVGVEPQTVRRALARSGLVVEEVHVAEDGSLSMLVALPSESPATDRPAALVAELLLRDVWDQMDFIEIGSSGRAMLLDSEGVLIAHPDKTLVLTRDLDAGIRDVALSSSPLGNVEVTRSAHGVPLLVAAARVEGDIAWFVAVVQDLADANVPLSQMLATTAIAVAAFMVIALITSLLITSVFATPLARLLAGTERIRAGDLSHRIPVQTEDEIGRLSRSFNAMVQDLEERSRKLAGSERRYRLLTESLTDLVFSLDLAGRIAYSNPQSRTLLGVEPEDMVGLPAPGFLVVAGADSQPRQEPHEVTHTTPDGRAVVLEVRLVRADSTDTGVAYYGVARDITERKDAEKRLEAYQEELRALALQLSLTEARERKRIAADIHDRIGQTLALTRIKLGQLRSTKLSAAATAMVKDALPLLEQVIQDTRSLIFSVSSPLLYEVGLAAALEQLVEQFSQRHAIAFRYVEKDPMPALEQDTAVLLFDTIKELLVNVVKHSSAKQVTVTADTPDGHLRLEVRDDGVGFDPARPREKGGGYGLFSVRERLESMKGGLDIEACRGKGTRITLEIPLP